MNQNSQFSNIVPESYKKLSSRLFYLCKELFSDDVDIRVIVAFAEKDEGRGNAILWLTKNFGMLPIEMAVLDGGISFQELSLFSGLTLIIQSVSLSQVESTKRSNLTSLENDIINLDSMNNLMTHIPVINKLPDSLLKASTDKLVQQIKDLGQYIADNEKKLKGSIIYFTGFSIPNVSAQSSNLASSHLIPWHLSISSKEGIERIYRQPELSDFLYSFPDNNPYMIDLESIILDMEMMDDIDLKD